MSGGEPGLREAGGLPEVRLLLRCAALGLFCAAELWLLLALAGRLPPEGAAGLLPGGDLAAALPLFTVAGAAALLAARLLEALLGLLGLGPPGARELLGRLDGLELRDPQGRALAGAGLTREAAAAVFALASARQSAADALWRAALALADSQRRSARLAGALLFSAVGAVCAFQLLACGRFDDGSLILRELAILLGALWCSLLLAVFLGSGARRPLPAAVCAGLVALACAALGRAEPLLLSVFLVPHLIYFGRRHAAWRRTSRLGLAGLPAPGPFVLPLAAEDLEPGPGRPYRWGESAGRGAARGPM